MDALLTRLKLPGIRSTYRDWIERAAKEELSFADFLQALLQEELALRQDKPVASAHPSGHAAVPALYRAV